MLALCELLHVPPSRLGTTPEDEAFLIGAMNIRAQRQEEAQRQQADTSRRPAPEEVRCGDE